MPQILFLILPLLLTLAAPAQPPKSPKVRLIVHQNSAYSTEQYLTYYLLSRIPLTQIKSDPRSDRVSISGRVILDLRGLPLPLQQQLAAGVAELIEGRRKLPGVTLDLSGGQLSLLDAETEKRATERRLEKERAAAEEAASLPNVEKTEDKKERPLADPNHGRSYDDMDVNPGFGGFGCGGWLRG